MVDETELLTLEALTGGVCPFCGGHWQAGLFRVAGDELPLSASEHALPTCVTFDRAAPSDFVRAVARLTGVPLLSATDPMVRVTWPARLFLLTEGTDAR